MCLSYIGFVVALVLAALVIIWIAYCMFIRERYKSELYNHNISDLQRKNNILNMNVEEKPTKKEITVSYFVLPSRRKQKDDGCDARPPGNPYPEAFKQNFTHSSFLTIDDVDGGSCDRDGGSCDRDGGGCDRYGGGCDRYGGGCDGGDGDGH